MPDSEIATVGVVGVGFMGAGICEVCARSGLDVVAHEPSASRLDDARRRIERSLERARARGAEDAEADDVFGRIEFDADADAVGRCDLVIEAVIEEVEEKCAVFSSLDGRLREATLLASNTSSIPIAQLAAATERPDRVLGLHFFSPVPAMRLVEVVRALETSDRTVAVAWGFVEGLGKRPILTKDRSGFIVNMLLVPYLMAAVRMFEDGFATREAIDEGMQAGCGHPMGPLALCDLIGLDVLYSVCESLYEEFKRPEYAPPPLLKRMVAAGRLGRKTGSGFYEYPA